MSMDMLLHLVMDIRPFQKGPLCGKFVGSGAFSDHMNIRNNFYQIIFPQKCSERFKLDSPPFFATAKIKVLKTMSIWVFRRTQRYGKLLEALFWVSVKLSLDSRSKKPIADMEF